LDVIRVDLDRISVKRKEKDGGFPIQMHPKEKEEKMLRKVSRVGRWCFRNILVIDFVSKKC